jgi:conjugative transposon TraN protein
MKRTVMILCGWLLGISLFAQNATKLIVPLSTAKTTSLIFPCAVRYVDIGTKEILVQKVEAAQNLLLVKAAIPGFKTTNLTVVTADGELYAIDVLFEDSLGASVHYIPAGPSRLSFPGELMNLRELQQYANGIADNPKQIRGVKTRKWDMRLSINGIYVKDEVLFFHCQLENFSPIDYGIDFIRFYLKDRKRGKRTAVQEIELLPVYKTGDLNSVKANNRNAFVFALEKFTIPDAKNFIVQVGERNGGRQLKIQVTNRKMLRAKILPTLN